MSKIALIIKREYISRVRKKSFIILTLLTPLLLSGLILIPVWLGNPAKEEDKSFLVVDNTGKYAGVFSDTLHYHFLYSNSADWEVYNSTEQFRSASIVISDDLLSNPDAITIYSDKPVSYADEMIVKEQLESFLRREKLSSFHIPNLQEILKESEINLHINTVNISDSNHSTNELTILISISGALLIYMFIFIHGSQLMHGVLEEKSNRIVEIIISSIKPAQLLTGKIIATLLVAFTQFACWMLLTAVVTLFITLFIPDQMASIDMPQALFSSNLVFDSTLLYMAGWYLIYFIAGYLLYASFFASIGAVIESGTDSQQFMLPVTIPLIFALYVAIYCFQNPEGELVFWCSMIPLTSPIVMVARLPFHVPVWQLITSMFVLLLTFILTTRAAAKIYKTGVLMYGKKIKYRDIWMWIKELRVKN